MSPGEISIHEPGAVPANCRAVSCRSRGNPGGARGAPGPDRSRTAPRSRVTALRVQRRRIPGSARDPKRAGTAGGCEPSPNAHAALVWVRTASKASSAKAEWAKFFGRWTRDWAALSPSRPLTSGFSARFEREARAIASLNHPNICTLYDVGPNYLVMELVEGETIAARLKSGPLPVNTALLYASQIAAALVEAHAKGIVHRDLKPGNIMIAKSGVKVLDFGLARSGQDETVTASRMIVGTPAYMAPEQREGKPADARTDIYAFGRVLFEMLTGARDRATAGPHPAAKAGKNRNPVPGKDPALRWQSAAELQRELTLAALPGRGTRIAVGAAAAIVALCAAGYVYLHRAPKLTVKGRIVLAEFENRTGDAVFDLTLRQGLAVQLEQSPFLSLVSDDSIRQALRLDEAAARDEAHSGGRP